MVQEQAVWEDEEGPTINGVASNKYGSGNAGCINLTTELPNLLDRAVRYEQRQPFGPRPARANWSGTYQLFGSSKLKTRIEKAKSSGAPMPLVRVCILFGVGGDINMLGLRHYFEQADDCVIINVPGWEASWSPDGRPWLFGISGQTLPPLGEGLNQIKALFDRTGILGGLKFKITSLGAYSTGYKGLVQSINEGLLPLADLNSVVFFDCAYRMDRPDPAVDDTEVNLAETERNNGPDEVDTGHSKSAYNTKRALMRIAKQAPGAKVVAYLVTPGGSPVYLNPTTADKWQYTVDFPTKIDLRRPTNAALSSGECLYGVVLTRVLNFAKKKGLVRRIPAEFEELYRVLPARGMIASANQTQKTNGAFRPTTTLLSWGLANHDKVKAAQGRVTEAVGIISQSQLLYGGNYPTVGNEAGAHHLAALAEFASEFLM
ncbi:MAG: hypothetical protein JSS72_08650 [Armatimonadetes bacterium]|nr:hypothetical protein [Armatimonadota bacterium]